METAKIKMSTTAQVEIQRRHRAQTIETAKIKTSTTARQRSLFLLLLPLLGGAGVGGGGGKMGGATGADLDGLLLTL